MELPTCFAGQTFDPQSRVTKIEMELLSLDLGWAVFIRSRLGVKSQCHCSQLDIETDADAVAVIKDFYRRLAHARKEASTRTDDPGTGTRG